MTFSKNDVLNLEFDKPITDGKTKNIWQTVHPGIVAFEQKCDAVLADGASVMTMRWENAFALIENLNMQNNNIFNYLQALGFQTTYKGLAGDFLFHETCNPLKLEFVVRFAAFDGATLQMREPEKYALKTDDGYDVGKANPKDFNEDGTIRPFENPIMETFHKYTLVETECGNIDLIPESAAKKIARYFQNGKPTKFAHCDPILITPQDDDDIWQVYDQKMPLSAGPLAVIDRLEGTLYDVRKDTMVRMPRHLNNEECIDRETELKLQNKTLKALRAIDFASRNTMFQKTGFGESGDIRFLDEHGFFAVIDGKLEYGVTDEGYKLTDDIVTDNMRLAFNGLPTKSMKKMFQNYDSLEQKLLISKMYAEGTKNFANMTQAYWSSMVR